MANRIPVSVLYATTLRTPRGRNLGTGTWGRTPSPARELARILRPGSRRPSTRHLLDKPLTSGPESGLPTMLYPPCYVCGATLGNNYKSTEFMLGLGGEYLYWECSTCGCVALQNPPEDWA